MSIDEYNQLCNTKHYVVRLFIYVLYTEPSMKITIPIRAKSLNCFYRCYGGKFYLSKTNREYIDELKRHFTAFWDTPNILIGKLTVILTLHFKTARNVDIDNMIKGIFDAMQGIIYDNDSQIFTFTATKILHATEDLIEIEILPFEEMTVDDVV